MTTGPVTVSPYYVITGSTNTAAEEGFNRIAYFFDSNPGFQLVAQNWSPGTENSYKVWRAVSASNTFDVVLKWSWNEYWDIWKCNTDYGVGIQIGAHPSQTAWSGTTTTTGDIAPVSPFKSGSYVFSRQNSVGADYERPRNYFEKIEDFDAGRGILVSGDYDSFCIATNASNNTDFEKIYYFGKFIPNDSDYNFPFIFHTNLGNSTPFIRNTTYGSKIDAASNGGAMTYVSVSNNYVTGVLPSNESYLLDYVTHYTAPMAISTSNFQKVLEYPIMIISTETGGGCVGYINDIRVTHNQIPKLSRLDSGNRLVLSSSDSATTFNLTIPWNSSSVINSGSFYSSSQCQFLTGSTIWGLAGQGPIFVDRLGTTEAITITNVTTSGTIENILYRGVSGGQFVYSTNTPPAGATDIVILRKYI